MDFTLTTPALLFPAISLLLLAYTNRYLTLAGLIRDLTVLPKAQFTHNIAAQIDNLGKRIQLIKFMQFFGVLSFFLCVTTMLFLFLGLIIVGEIVFGTSLITLLISLALSLKEVTMSTKALEIQLSSLEVDQ